MHHEQVDDNSSFDPQEISDYSHFTSNNLAKTLLLIVHLPIYQALTSNPVKSKLTSVLLTVCGDYNISHSIKMTTAVASSSPEVLISSRLENLCNEVRSIKASLATSLQGQDSRGGGGGEKDNRTCTRLKSSNVK